MSCRWNHIRIHRWYHGQAGAGAYPGGGAGDERDGLLPDAAQPPARLAHQGDRAGGDRLHHPQPGHRAVHWRPPGLLRLLLHDPGQLNLFNSLASCNPSTSYVEALCDTGGLLWRKLTRSIWHL